MTRRKGPPKVLRGYDIKMMHFFFTMRNPFDDEALSDGQTEQLLL